MVTGAARTALERRGRRLEYVTVGWNCIEAVVTITTGIASHSLGMVAFGLDSCVEVFASLVVVWHLGGADDDERSQRAGRLIAGAFALLAVYLLGDAVHGVLGHATPTRSWLGLGFLAATVAVMVVLALAKRSTGRQLDNAPLMANASLTLLDGGLAAGTLVAVFLAVQVGWWWADAVAAAVIAVAALHEARDAWRGEVA